VALANTAIRVGQRGTVGISRDGRNTFSQYVPRFAVTHKFSDELPVGC